MTTDHEALQPQGLIAGARCTRWSEAKILLLAAVLAIVALVPTPAVRAENAEVTLYGRTLLEQINLYRRDRDLGQLTFDPGLIRLARTHSFTMFKQKRVSHLDFKTRFERSGSRLCVENVGWHYTTPLKQFDAWRKSSGHDQNMLTKGILKAGIAEIGGYVTFFACQ